MGLDGKAHQTRIKTHNQETGIGDGRHQKLKSGEDFGWKCNFEKICRDFMHC